MGIVTTIATSLAKTIFKVIAEGASGIVKLLLVPLTSLISGIVANAFKVLFGGISALGKVFGKILGPIGKVITLLLGTAYADASYRQEVEKETYGEEYSKIQDEFVDQEEKDNSSVGEYNLKRKENQRKIDERNARAAKARAQYEKETLIPKMEAAEYEPSRGPSDKLDAPLLTFKHKITGKTADLDDIKKALHGELWKQKEMMNLIYNEKKTFAEMSSGVVEKLSGELESEMAKAKKDYIDPLITPITDKLKGIEERLDGLQNNIGSKLESMKKSGEDTAEQLKKGFDSVPKTNPETEGKVTIIGSNNNIGGGDTIQNGEPMNVRHDILARSQGRNTAAV
jgi:hypothetical protein